MTKTEAHALLSAVKAGTQDADEAAITQALAATGDLTPTPVAVVPMLPVASFLNRSGRVMRGAGEVVL